MKTVPIQMLDRIRRIGSTSTVLGSLPILHFGDISNARAVTIGINPSHREYLNPQGLELTGTFRRFHTMSSLAAIERASLTAGQCSTAIEAMNRYFHPEQPVYGWFRHYERALNGLGFSYMNGSAAHLDLVQESTFPIWRKLSRQEQNELLLNDEPFLRWQLESRGISLVFCTSKLVREKLCDMLDAKFVRSGAAYKRVWVVSRGQVVGREVAVVGLDHPLGSAPGLKRDEQTALGHLLGTEINSSGFQLPFWNRTDRNDCATE